MVLKRANKELGKVYAMILMKGWSSKQIKVGDIFVRQTLAKIARKKRSPTLENFSRKLFQVLL